MFHRILQWLRGKRQVATTRKHTVKKRHRHRHDHTPFWAAGVYM